MRHRLSQYRHFDPDIKINQRFKVLSYFSLNCRFSLSTGKFPVGLRTVFRMTKIHFEPSFASVVHLELNLGDINSDV